MAGSKKKTVWWILGLIALLLLIYFIFFNDERDEVVAEPETKDYINIREGDSTVSSFVDFISSDTNRMTLDHAFTSNSLIQLGAALDAMADAVNFDIKADLDRAKINADKITLAPFDTSHADNIRIATDIYSNAIQTLQRAKYPSLSNEVFELKNASTSIDPETLTLKQRDAVKDFFKKAASVLGKMN